MAQKPSDAERAEALAAYRLRMEAFHQENRDFMLMFQADQGDKLGANLIPPLPSEPARSSKRKLSASSVA